MSSQPPNTDIRKGTTGTLIVIVRLYEPQLICDPLYGQPPPVGSCSDLIAKMPVSTDRKLFGYKESPGVEEPTPITTRTRDRKSSMKSFTRDHSLRGS